VSTDLRNIAIIAHVDHGKTTLVDRLLQQTGTLDGRGVVDRVMDTGELERERGITILSKNTAIRFGDIRINIVDTPGHADFGGEVERVLSMVDSVLLVVDAVEGPMPQTRFVTAKAFAQGLNPIVVVNKVDRPSARPHEVVGEVFDLFDRLGASEAQLDFPVVFASAVEGRSGLDPDAMAEDMTPLLETVVTHVPAPRVDAAGRFQMQVSALDYSRYVGVLGIGRITRGSLRPNVPVAIVDSHGRQRRGRVLEVLGYSGLERAPVAGAEAGDIVCVSGVEGIAISDTLCDVEAPEPLPALVVDEPTVTMTFQVNTSPFSGRDGRFLTSRQLRDRLMREAQHNVALNVADTEDPDQFRVSGRGELHLSVLIETMRREGYELAVSRPEVITRTIDGVPCEPFEELVVDLEEQHQGAVMEELGARKGELTDMNADGSGRVRLSYVVPARALLGFRPLFLSLTSGSGIMTHTFAHYGPQVGGRPGTRGQGVLISNVTGRSVAYALFNLQARGRLMVGPNEEVYEGMIVGVHSRTNDLTVNPLKEKKLTNVRAAGSDDNVLLSAPMRLSLEQAMDFIAEDELVEVTPRHVRVRKRLRKEVDRRRDDRRREQNG
jgi:GTP-binding protein